MLGLTVNEVALVVTHVKSTVWPGAAILGVTEKATVLPPLELPAPPPQAMISNNEATQNNRQEALRTRNIHHPRFWPIGYLNLLSC